MTSVLDVSKVRARRRRPYTAILVYAALIVFTVPFIFPLWWMATASLLKNNEIFAWPMRVFPSNPQWQNYAAVFERQPFAQQYFNSFYIGALVTIGTLIVATLAGYAFARIKFRGRGVLFALILSGLLMPSEVTIIPLFKMVSSLGWIDTHWPLIIIPALGTPAAFAIFLMRQFFVALPVELEEAGTLDGLNRFGLFLRIALPLAKPALAAITILTFLRSWDSFLEPLVYLSSKQNYTIPLALTQYTDPSGVPIWNEQFAASTLTVIPVLIIFVIAQRHFVEGLSGTGLKG